MNASTFRELGTDERLNAWLDDELNPEQRAEVDAWLRDHPEDLARVRLWAADRDALRARLEPVVEEPVPTRLEQVVWSHAPATAPSGWMRWAAAVAIFALGGLVGAGGTWRLLEPTRVPVAGAGWEQRALAAHAVYVPEVRHPVEVSVQAATPQESRAQEEHLVRWLTRRIDRPVKLFDLRAHGYELVGGRLLPDQQGAWAQLMYQKSGEAAPQRVTVYLRKPERDAPAGFRYERHGELGMFYWVEGATGYALVGAMPRDELLALAESIYRQVPS